MLARVRRQPGRGGREGLVRRYVREGDRAERLLPLPADHGVVGPLGTRPYIVTHRGEARQHLPARRDVDVAPRREPPELAREPGAK